MIALHFITVRNSESWERIIESFFVAFLKIELSSMVWSFQKNKTAQGKTKNNNELN